MHPTLPIGFESWTQVLTDWGVGWAYRKAKAPRCLKDRPDLAAPLIVQLGALLRDHLFYHRVREVSILQLQVTEPAYAAAGGAPYRKLCCTLEATQHRFFAVYHEADASPERVARYKAMQQVQSAWTQSRRNLEPLVQQARTKVARTYWNAAPLGKVPDTVFAHVPAASPAALLARIHPAWWGTFFGRIQYRLGHGHLANGELIAALPQLRRAARRYKLSAVIDDWRSAHSDDWGWYGEAHYRMLEPRTAKKARELTRWLKTLAPGYLTDPLTRQTLDAQLAERLAQSDPWQLPVSESHFGMGNWAHGRN